MNWRVIDGTGSGRVRNAEELARERVDMLKRNRTILSASWQRILATMVLLNGG